MSHAAIVGGGVIGGGWAARFLLMGWEVRLFDPAPGAEARLATVLGAARRALPMLYDRALPPEGRLIRCDSVEEAVEGAAWVQESIPERLDLKHRVLAQIQAASAPGTPIGSSTSGFKPSELREGAARPGDIFVAHPFNPVYLLPLVELVGAPDGAEEVLRGIGMFPLPIRAEIDAHVADRFLEAVWREALWLVRDGIATTEEIDEAIRMGFGLRWAQMGLFETYRIAGGEAGMTHFLDQFGPALKWPWTKLMDVPELDDDLVAMIASQSDAQSGARSIAELERLRDDNLVSILRALRQQGAAAGAHLLKHEATLPRVLDPGPPMVTVDRTIPVDWTDYNGHMNEGRYGQVFSDAADAVMAWLGADADYIAAGHSYFTAETTVRYLFECHAGERCRVETTALLAGGRKLKLSHEMFVGDHLRATCEQFMLHVSLQTRKSCDPLPQVADRLAALAEAHGAST